MNLHAPVLKRSITTTLIFLTATGIALSQGGKRGAIQATRSLDQAAEKAETEYLSNLADLASKYEDAGEIQKASEMLRSILKIKPEADVVKSKLKQMEEMVFKDNVQTVEVDAGSGWIAAGILVSKDKPIRIEADGTYKFSVNDVLGPSGYTGENLVSGIVEGVPCGGLMAVIGKGMDTGGKRDPKDLPRPFFIGKQKEIVPKESGPLLFRVNVPEGAKCTGKLKVKITGNIAVLSR